MEITLKKTIEQSHQAANDVYESLAKNLFCFQRIDFTDRVWDGIFYSLSPAEKFVLRVDAINMIDGKFIQCSPEEIKKKMRKGIEEYWRLHRKEYE